MRKIPFAVIELTSQRVRGLRGTSELPGRPVVCNLINTHIHTGSEGWEEANGVRGGIGIGGGNGDGNRVRGEYGDVKGGGDRAGAGTATATGVEVNKGAKDGNGDGSRGGAGTGTGTETRGRSQDGNGGGSGDRNQSSFGDENGDEDGNGDGNEGEIGAGGGEVKKRKRPHENCTSDQALLFRTRHHLGRQGIALTGIRKLRSQDPVPVHMHRTEGVTGPERQEGSNGVGSGIGVGGGNRDGNGVRGGDGDGAGTGTGEGVEANEGAQDGNGDGSGDGDGGGDPWTNTGWERGREKGPKTRAIVEMGMGTRMGTGTRIGSGRAEERRRSARNRTRLVNAMWETGKTWVERGENLDNKEMVH